MGLRVYGSGVKTVELKNNGDFTFRSAETGARLEFSNAALKAYNADGQRVNIADDGTFWFGNPSGINSIVWNGSTLAVRGSLDADDIVTGTLAAARLSAAIAYITDTAMIGEAVIETANIGSEAVETSNIADLNVTTLKIAGNAVTLPILGYTAGNIAVNSYPDEIVIAQVTMTNSGAGMYLHCQCFALQGSPIGDPAGGNGGGGGE